MIFDQTKFDNGIVAEFGIPDRETGKVVVLCDGAPTVPSKRRLIRFLVKRGFSVFHIRYRGTWESSGDFLDISPDKDVISVLDELSKGFRGVWTKERYQVNPEKVVVIGSSFGGPAGLLASGDERVSKVVVICPVVDWAEQNEHVESIDEFREQIEFGYGGAYRNEGDVWSKLKGGSFYNPVSCETEIEGSKVFVIQTLDDDTVSAGPVKLFAERIKAQTLFLKKGGHVGASKIMKWRIWRKVKNFLNS